MSRKLSISNLRGTKNVKQPNGGFRETRIFKLDEDHTLCLITKYSDIARLRIIREWKAMKAKLLPKTYIQTLEAFLESEKQKERLLLENKAKEEIIEQKQEFIDNHVHFPKYIRAEEYGEDFLSRKEIKEQYFPELTIDRLTLVLSYYNCDKSLYKNTKNMIIEVFNINEIQTIRSKFENDLEAISASKSGKSMVCRHKALPN